MAFSDDDIKENGPSSPNTSWGYRNDGRAGAGAATRADDRNNKWKIELRSRRKRAPVRILKEKKECPTNQK